jgi:hypothetical protein
VFITLSTPLLNNKEQRRIIDSFKHDLRILVHEYQQSKQYIQCLQDKVANTERKIVQLTEHQPPFFDEQHLRLLNRHNKVIHKYKNKIFFAAAENKAFDTAINALPCAVGALKTSKAA